MRRILRIRPVLVPIFGIAFILFSVVFAFGPGLIPFIFYKFPWKDHTSPLTSEQRIELCNKLNLPQDDSKCIEDAVAYGPDFFPTIKERLDPENVDGVTYQDVEEVLGDYFDYCSPFPPEAIGVEEITCYYDLRGDEEYPIAVYFDEKGQLEDIFNNTSGE